MLFWRNQWPSCKCRTIWCLLLFSLTLLATNVIVIASSPPSYKRKGCNIVNRGNSLATTWGEGNSYCLELGGRLCYRNEYCPNGRGRAPLGGYRDQGLQAKTMGLKYGPKILKVCLPKAKHLLHLQEKA